MAAALGKLGAKVGFITAFGNDQLAKDMRKLLEGQPFASPLVCPDVKDMADVNSLITESCSSFSCSRELGNMSCNTMQRGGWI